MNQGTRCLFAWTKRSTGDLALPTSTASDVSAAPFVLLAERIRRGERDAEPELIRMVSAGLCAMLRHRLGFVADVADIQQEALLILIEKLRAGDVAQTGAIPQFLRSVALNLVASDQRKFSRRRTDNDEELLAHIADAKQSCQAMLEQAQVKKIVRDCLATLPTERDREILTRAYLRDEDKPHICNALGLTSEHFDRVMYRAKQRLRELLLTQQSGGLDHV
jgi:RNA polymerase sigma factor (sigma-70 family)